MTTNNDETFDGASDADRAAAINRAIANYGPTPLQLRGLCHCPVCVARRRPDELPPPVAAAKSPDKPKPWDLEGF